MTEEDDLAEPDADPILEIDGDTLAAVQCVVRIVAGLDWFAAVGTPLAPAVRADADAYLGALGFSDLGVAPILDWREARAALEERAWGSAWAEAEDQARSELAAEALHRSGEDVVGAAVGYVSERAQSVAMAALEGTAGLLGGDPGLIEAAAADARDAACQALLVTLSESGADHPLALKFRLFEAGRWPVGVVGNSFNLF